MLEFYVRLVKEHVIPQVEYYDRLNLNDGTYAGTVAWVSDAVNYMGTAMENGYEIIPAEYTVKKGCESGDGWYAKPATLYAVSKNTEHPEESAVLLDFLLNSQEMTSLQGIEKGIPLSSSARMYLEQENKLTGLQYDASQKMETNQNLQQIQPFMENNAMIEAFIAGCNAVFYEKQTAEQAGTELYQKAKELLK